MTPPFKAWVGDRSEAQRRARRAGADRFIEDYELPSLRVNRADRDVTEFIPRDQAVAVRNLLAERQPVLVHGPSMAGKTRLVIEVLRESWADAPFLFPANPESLKSLLDSTDTVKPGTVVFLDDLDRFFGLCSLTDVDGWLATQCVVVATIMESQYEAANQSGTVKPPGWDLVNRMQPVPIDPKHSAGEMLAIRSGPYADLAHQAELHGLPAVLGGAPKARSKFHNGEQQRSLGWALVRAAADWRRIGMGATSRDTLQRLVEHYPDIPAGTRTWDDAWLWASEKFNHSVALMNQDDTGLWRVLDLIADDARSPIPADVLEAAANEELTPQDSLALAVATYTSAGMQSSPTIERLLASALASPEARVQGQAALIRGALLADAGTNPARAVELLELAHRLAPGNSGTSAVLAMYLHQLGKDPDRTEQMFLAALAGGKRDPDVLVQFAQFLEDGLWLGVC